MKTIENFMKDPISHAEFIYGITDHVIQLGLDMIAETFTSMDEAIRESGKRKQNWVIVRRDETTLLTSLGIVAYKKTLFKNKGTGTSEYLLDRIMGLESHARMTEDAQAKMLEEAVDSSYEKGGQSASITARVSRQTVKNKIHGLRFEAEKEDRKVKKQVPYLYIDADEDHVSLQYLEKKGDRNGKGAHIIMPKIAYVYEGIQGEAPKSKRRRLLSPKYFGGVYEGREGVETFWKEVNGYIESTYEMEAIKHIYIQGDGAGWIKSGRKWIEKSIFVLDRFHLQKSILGATAHLLDSAEDARAEIYQGIYRKKKWMVQTAFEKILSVTGEGYKKKQVEASMNYLLGHWDGILQSQKNKKIQTGCSAEGHVSHIYADRLSSRPLGWSRVGVDKMARLRIYKANQGNMLTLVRLQKEELPAAAGSEEERIILSGEMFRLERNRLSAEQRYVERMTHSIPYPQIKKMAYLKNHIWGL